MSDEKIKYSILLVEDEPPQRKVLTGFLENKGYLVFAAASAKEAFVFGENEHIDLLLTDLRLGSIDGIEVLKKMREKLPHMQGIVLTAYGTVDDATKAMKAGAYDFVSKPVDLMRLETLIEKALDVVDLAKENRTLKSVIENSSGFASVIGRSNEILDVIKIGARVSGTSSSVLILGESGTGKEVMARAIHTSSQRRDKPFITVNCAALPDTLIESELFGHEAGAFTGANKSKEGRFEQSSGGTLFLDEIGEVPLHVQVKLLNVLQSQKITRLGGSEEKSIDVRIIAATNRDLSAGIKEGTFREDLFYRLNVITITMPSLKKRREDIPLLVEFFLDRLSKKNGMEIPVISDNVFDMLNNYDFPGNVRELENLMEHALVMCENSVITIDDFPSNILSPASGSEQKLEAGGGNVNNGGLEYQVRELEKSLIMGALEKSMGNQSAAARQLKITERNIRYKMKKYNINYK